MQTNGAVRLVLQSHFSDSLVVAVFRVAQFLQLSLAESAGCAGVSGIVEQVQGQFLFDVLTVLSRNSLTASLTTSATET